MVIDRLTKLYENEFQGVDYNPEYDQIYRSVNYYHTNEDEKELLRPMLLLLSCEMFGGDNRQALNPAIALQMLYNSSLIHEDIIDEIQHRSNSETVQQKFGKSEAIITGDIMFIIGFKYLSNVDDKHFQNVMKVFNQTASMMIEGKQMELYLRDSENISLEKYLTCIEYKSASTFAAASKIGAILADASEKNQNLVYNFGNDLGVAIQLKRDLKNYLHLNFKEDMDFETIIWEKYHQAMKYLDEIDANENFKKQLIELVDYKFKQ